MSSVLGHGLAGMSVWALARRLPALEPLEHKGWLAAAAAAACIPDLDSLLGLLHRGPTHTLGFSILCSGLGAAAAAACGLRRRALWIWPVFGLIVWLHPLMDLLSGGGPAVTLFRPFWNREFHPISGGLPLHRFTSSVDGLLGLLLDPWTLRGMAVEAAIFGPLFASTLVQRRWLKVTLAAAGAGLWIGLAVVGTT
jgi:membrane-bound metal-dependent hydrolase YbcI (DUF457 family)